VPPVVKISRAGKGHDGRSIATGTYSQQHTSTTKQKIVLFVWDAHMTMMKKQETASGWTNRPSLFFSCHWRTKATKKYTGIIMDGLLNGAFHSG
jgi:hypothetical protein